MKVKKLLHVPFNPYPTLVAIGKKKCPLIRYTFFWVEILYMFGRKEYLAYSFTN